jgi:hypothetical protein
MLEIVDEARLELIIPDHYILIVNSNSMQSPREILPEDIGDHMSDSSSPDEFPINSDADSGSDSVSDFGSGVRRDGRQRDCFWHDVNRVRALLRRPEPCDASELAGFFDGDGCFYNAQIQVGCNITQCHYPTLRRIQECYGGTMSKRDPKGRSEKQRYQYGLSFRNIEVAAIVPIIKDHLVLKGARARRVLESLDLYNKTDEASAKRRLELAENTTDEYAFDRINKSYIRGLFCAEGCLRHDSVSIAQKGCTDLLRAMQVYIGTQLGRGPNFGIVNNTAWGSYRNTEVKLFVDWLTDNNTRRLFHEEKAAQVDAFYAYIETRDPAFTVEMSRLKHVDFDIPSEELEKVNVSAREFTAKLRSVVAGREVAPNAPDARPLTGDQRGQAIKLLRDTDESLETIANRIGGTKSQVSYLKKTEKIERPNPKKRTAQLTPDQQRVARRLLHDEHVSYAAIANEAQCGKGQVFTFAVQIDAPPRKRGRKYRATGVEVATEKPPAPATGEKRTMAPRLTPAQKQKLENLLDARATNKMTHDAIAKEVGCTKGQVATFKKPQK